MNKSSPPKDSTTSRPSLVQRGLAGGLSLSLFFTQCVGVSAAENRFWEERRRAASAQSPLTVARATPLPGLPEFQTAPVPLGIQKSPEAKGGASVQGSALLTRTHRTAPDAPLVIHIQDLHGVVEAQKNISSFIKDLARERGAVLVGLEGAEGDFRLAPWRDYVSVPLRDSAADALLERGLIGGPEHAGLTSADPLKMFGAEDLSLYNVNLAAAREAIPQRERRIGTLNPWVRALGDAEERWASPALRAHLERGRARAAGRLSLGAYADALMGHSLPGLPPSPQLRLFVRALRMEKSLSFDRVQKERTAFLKDLTPRLSPEEVKDLVSLAERFRAGRSTHSAFFAALERTAARKGLSLAGYPALTAYRDYSTTAEDIDRNGLLDELSQRERAVSRALAASEGARRVVEAEERMALLLKLADLSLTPDEWSRYQKERALVWDLPREMARLGIVGLSPLDRREFKSNEDFFALAERRNAALVERLAGRMRATGARTAVLVAGGFHSPGLESALTEGRFNVEVFTPQVTAAPEGNPGLAVLVRGPLALEKLFAGEPIALVDAPALSPTATGEPKQAVVERTWLTLITVPLAQGKISWAAARARMVDLVTVLSATVRARLDPLGKRFRMDFVGRNGKSTAVAIALEESSGGETSLSLVGETGATNLNFTPAPRSGRFDLELWMEKINVLKVSLGRSMRSFLPSRSGTWISRGLGLLLAPVVLLEPTLATGAVFLPLLGKRLAVSMVLPGVSTEIAPKDPVDNAEVGRARFKDSLRNITDPSRAWIVVGDFDMLGAKNALFGKFFVGDLNDKEKSPWALFSHQSLFLELRKAAARAIRNQGGQVHRGEGGDELVLEFQGEYPEVKKKLEAVVEEVNKTFSDRYAFFAIHKAHLTKNEVASLKAWAPTGVLVHYGEGFRLAVEKEGTSALDSEKMLGAVQSKLTPNTVVSPLLFETKKRGPFTLSLGAVNARDVMAILADRENKSISHWFDKGWAHPEDSPDSRMVEVLIWGERLAEDALKAAKQNGRSRAVVLNSVDAIEHVMAENRVTHEKILQFSGQSTNEALNHQSPHDELTQWLQLRNFRGVLEKAQGSDVLHHVWVGSYTSGARIEKRAFNKLQGLPGADHDMGNKVIKTMFDFFSTVLGVKTEENKQSGARAPPDGAYYLSKTRDLTPPPPYQFQGIHLSLKETLPAGFKNLGPTVFTASLRLGDLEQLSGYHDKYKNPMFIAEMISKTVAHTIGALESSSISWREAVNDFADVRILHEPAINDANPYWLVQVVFNKDKFEKLKAAFHEAERDMSEDAHRELTGVLMPRYRLVDEKNGPRTLAQVTQAPLSSPQDLEALFPVLPSLGLEGRFLPEGTIPEEQKERESRRTAWADQFGAEHGVGRGEIFEKPSWNGTVIDGSPHEEFAVLQSFAEARHLEGSSAHYAARVVDALQKGIAKSRPNGFGQKLGWADSVAKSLALLWAAEGSYGVGFRRARDLRAVMASIALLSYDKGKLDSELMGRLLGKVENRLNEYLRVFARVEAVSDRALASLESGKDIYVDVTGWEEKKRRKDLKIYLSRLGRILDDAETPFRGRLVFVDRSPTNGLTFPFEFESFLEKSGVDQKKVQEIRCICPENVGNKTIFSDHKVNVALLREYVKGKDTEKAPVDVVTHDPAGWDLTGTEALLLLLLPGGDMVYHMSEKLKNDLDRLKFVSIAA